MQIAAVLYWSWLDLLEQIDDGSGAALRIREDDVALSFELVVQSDHVDEALEPLRDRVEALGGRVEVDVDPDGRTRVRGLVPAE